MPTLTRPAQTVDEGAYEFANPTGELSTDIGDRDMLLLLDNFEQVAAASPDVAGLVASCPRLVVLLTSRERLSVAAERLYPLGALADAPAVELFRQRAASVVPDFDAPFDELAVLCRRLDGLPLAVELAAARANVLSPAEILDRVRGSVDVLGIGPRDAPQRQQTLRATIDWSLGSSAIASGNFSCASRSSVERSTSPRPKRLPVPASTTSPPSSTRASWSALRRGDSGCATRSCWRSAGWGKRASSSTRRSPSRRPTGIPTSGI